MLVIVDMPELPLVAVAPDVAEAPDDSVAPNGRIPVDVPPAIASLLALCVAALIDPAAVATPPNPEYVCK